MPLQDVRAPGRYVALKLSTKALHVLEEDEPPECIRSREFATSLYKASWEYRCALIQVACMTHWG
jgi:hypothetical protein